MRIAQIANVVERVPPKRYGGTERMVHALTEGLVKRGHEVTLFATGDSLTSANLIACFPKGLREMGSSKDLYGTNSQTLLHIGMAYQYQREFDIIHDHLTPLSLPVANISQTPVVMTLHGPITEDNQEILSALNTPYLVSISKAQINPRLFSNINHIGTVYNGLDMKAYPFSRKEKGYLLYVGRISEEKGVHLAIKVAKTLDLPLIIAAKLDETVAHDVVYFKKYIKPNLDKKIKWIGEVSEKERNKLMSQALCFLHPVTWPEPFGLTLIEAMACGCPVVALNRGSIPEVIASGTSGYVVNNLSEMIKAVKKIKQINRLICRKYALENFSADKMVEGYEAIYQKIIWEDEQRSKFTSQYYDDAIQSVVGQLIKKPSLHEKFYSAPADLLEKEKK